MIISGYITNSQIAANLLIDIDKASQATSERGEHPLKRMFPVARHRDVRTTG
jgi:hypothetical protein